MEFSKATKLLNGMEVLNLTLYVYVVHFLFFFVEPEEIMYFKIFAIS